MNVDSVRPVTPIASVVVQGNANAMTLGGTNSWILRAPGAKATVIVDPGEEGDSAHARSLAEHGQIEAILVTHHHHDHQGLALELSDLGGAPIFALSPQLVPGARPIADQDTLAAAGMQIQVLATPGHSTDSATYIVRHGRAGALSILSGDTLLGSGSSVIAEPDGRLDEYLRSLEWYTTLPADSVLLPGHGPVREDAAAVARRQLEHRHARLLEIEALLLKWPDLDESKVVELVYGHVDEGVKLAAAMSARAQLRYLRESNRPQAGAAN